MSGIDKKELASILSDTFHQAVVRPEKAKFIAMAEAIVEYVAKIPEQPDELPDIRVALKASGLSHWAWKAMQIPAVLSPEENAHELHSLMLDRAAELVAKVLQAPTRESVEEAYKLLSEIELDAAVPLSIRAHISTFLANRYYFKKEATNG